jgi:hypothetical protein
MAPGLESGYRETLPACLGKVARGRRFLVTSRGRVIAEPGPPSPSPPEAEAARELLRASVIAFTDPLAPASGPAEWDANR